MTLARAPADDSRHSVLQRARPVSQASLDAFGPEGDWGWTPPSERGTYDIKEVEARSALTPLAFGEGGWSLSPYTGCSHACLYCFVPDVTRVERPNWGSYVIVKRNLPTVLARDLKRREPARVFMSSATDPYQPVEADFRITRACLELLARHEWSVRLLTRSPLVLRDVDVLKRFDNLTVGLSIPTLDDEARRVIEPHAPPIEGRLKALRRLADAGLETSVSFSPAYPLTRGITPDDVAEAFHQASVRKAWISRWNYLPSLRGPLAERVRGTPYEGFATLVEDPAYYRHFIKRMAHACAKRGITLRSWT